MDNDSAIAALGALAQGTRLDVFRLLVRHEPDGLAAGEIARRLDVPQNTMSAHLGILARAGIIRSERHSRSIIYRAELDGLRALTLFLVKDCCAGSPELCAPLLAELAPAAERTGHGRRHRDLPQPRVRHVAQHASDDPQRRH